MKTIYIKNYLETSREEKLNFFKFLENSNGLSVSRQRVIFAENSLLLDFDKDTNIQEAKKNIESFFKRIHNVSVYTVNQIIQNKDNLTLEFDNKKLRVER